MAAEPTLVVCSSKVKALEKKRNNTDLAEQILRFAGTSHDAVAPDAWPEACRRCRAALIVDDNSTAFGRFIRGCLRERRLTRERNAMCGEDVRTRLRSYRPPVRLQQLRQTRLTDLQGGAGGRVR